MKAIVMRYYCKALKTYLFYVVKVGNKVVKVTEIVLMNYFDKEVFKEYKDKVTTEKSPECDKCLIEKVEIDYDKLPPIIKFRLEL